MNERNRASADDEAESAPATAAYIFTLGATVRGGACDRLDKQFFGVACVSKSEAGEMRGLLSYERIARYLSTVLVD